jgi:hypothetical protein
VAVALAVAMSAPVATAATGPTEALPTAFKVAATNGFRAEALGLYDPEVEKGFVAFTLRRGGTSATYTTTNIRFAENSFAADFGALGEIDVHAVPSGGAVTERFSCDRKPAKVPAGRWEGTIRLPRRGRLRRGRRDQRHVLRQAVP